MYHPARPHIFIYPHLRKLNRGKRSGKGGRRRSSPHPARGWLECLTFFPTAPLGNGGEKTRREGRGRIRSATPPDERSPVPTAHPGNGGEPQEKPDNRSTRSVLRSLIAHAVGEHGDEQAFEGRLVSRGPVPQTLSTGPGRKKGGASAAQGPLAYEIDSFCAERIPGRKAAFFVFPRLQPTRPPTPIGRKALAPRVFRNALRERPGGKACRPPPTGP